MNINGIQYLGCSSQTAWNEPFEKNIFEMYEKYGVDKAIYGIIYHVKKNSLKFFIQYPIINI